MRMWKLALLFIVMVGGSYIWYIQQPSYTKVTVVEDQVSFVDFDDKRYGFSKDEQTLYIHGGLDLYDPASNLLSVSNPQVDEVYYFKGIEIVVSEISLNYFVLLVKPEWN